MEKVMEMLRAIINGQSAMKEELLSEIRKVDQKVDKLDEKVDKVEMSLTKRINKLGSQLAYFEDDAPTRDEHDELEKRVGKLEKKLAVV